VPLQENSDSTANFVPRLVDALDGRFRLRESAAALREAEVAGLGSVSSSGSIVYGREGPASEDDCDWIEPIMEVPDDD
jgi:hypothetical protein